MSGLNKVGAFNCECYEPEMGSMGIIKLGSIELQLSRAQIGKAPCLLVGVYIIYHNILTSNIDKLGSRNLYMYR